MTYTQAINYVLRKMRETQVSDPASSTYALFIGDLVNEAKREVEDAFDWKNLRTVSTETMVQGTTLYSLTGSGERARLLYAYHNELKFYMTEMKVPLMDHLLAQSGSAQQGRVIHYYQDQVDSSQDTQIKVYPEPDSTAQTVDVTYTKPQADFDNGNEVLAVPYWPVILLAYAKALDERGENAGAQVTKADDAAALALGDAVAHEANSTQRGEYWSLDSDVLIGRNSYHG